MCFYNTFDAQGNFVFRRPEKSSESGSHIPVYLPLTSDKVETSDIRSGFQVTDGSGNIYRFKEAEYSNTGKITGWKLTDVTSLKQDRLSFRMSHRSSLMQTVMTIMQWRIWVKVTVTDIGREWMEN